MPRQGSAHPWQVLGCGTAFVQAQRSGDVKLTKDYWLGICDHEVSSIQDWARGRPSSGLSAPQLVALWGWPCTEMLNASPNPGFPAFSIRAHVPSHMGCIQTEWKVVSLQRLQSRIGRGTCLHWVSHAVTVIYSASPGAVVINIWTSYGLWCPALSTRGEAMHKPEMKGLSKKEKWNRQKKKKK